MIRKLSGWGRAALGAVIVLGAVWIGGTIYTFFNQINDEERLTRIERIVVHPHHHGSHKGVVAGSGSHPSGQPTPGQPGGNGTTPPSGSPPPSGGNPNPPSGQNHPLVPSLPETPSLPEPQIPVKPETHPVPTHTGVVESVGPTVGHTVSGAAETVCSTTAAIRVGCP